MSVYSLETVAFGVRLGANPSTFVHTLDDIDDTTIRPYALQHNIQMRPYTGKYCRIQVSSRRQAHGALPTASKIATQCASETTGYRLGAVAVAAATAMYEHQHLCLQSTVERIHFYTNTHNFTHQTNDSHTEWNVRCDVMW